MAKILALDPASTYPYILESQRGDKEEEQIKWELKNLTAKEEALIEDKLGHLRDGDFHIKLGSQNRLALDIALMGVEGFEASDGTLVEVKRKGTKVHGFVNPLLDSFVDRIPKAVRQELATAIMRGTTLKVEDEKN